MCFETHGGTPKDDSIARIEQLVEAGPMRTRAEEKELKFYVFHLDSQMQRLQYMRGSMFVLGIVSRQCLLIAI